jgi:ABC-2 type transport system ATP-binding protein
MDEAERCHRLAILDHGVKVADGTPRQLQADTGMQIIEVLADDPYQAQDVLSGLAIVASVTQLGTRLRVLVPQDIPDALNSVTEAVSSRNIVAESTLVAASLEDVFVAATLDRTDLAA